MDPAMRLVQENCGKYMNVYASCVEKYPETWHLDCEVPRVKLAACADVNPVIVEIKEKCSDAYEEYEKCLFKNPVDVQQCTDLLQLFDDCAKEVTQRVQNAS